MSEQAVRFGNFGCANISCKVSRATRLTPKATLYAFGRSSFVDADHVPLPTSLHVKSAVLAAQKKKKPLLLVKPVELNVEEYMDAHHPRTAKMRVYASDSQHFGQLEAMAEGKIRFGILGCGNIAQKVSRGIMLAPNATIYAIGSRSIEKASKFASDNCLPPTAKIYGSYEGVLDDPNVDAVYMSLPTSLHLIWAVLAAEKGKHVLSEKPVALNVMELDTILKACESNGVQFMDGTMWMHHPRTSNMKEFLSNVQNFGQLKSIYSSFTFEADSDFLKNDIRVKPDLDALGSLGDLGWYCIRAILLANNYELPKTVVASRNPVFNEAGVILSCGSSLYWADGRVANFHCSFLADLSMDITALGSKGSLRVHDFVIPFQENVSHFYTASNSFFIDLSIGWEPEPSKNIVTTDLPQEALMVKEFANLVANIKGNGVKPEWKWPDISRKTQLVVDAVKASIEKGFEPVEVIG